MDIFSLLSSFSLWGYIKICSSVYFPVTFFSYFFFWWPLLKFYLCNIAIFRKNIYLVFIHSSWIAAPKTLGISWVLRRMGQYLVSWKCFQEGTFGPHPRVRADCQRTSHVIKGLELSPLPLLHSELGEESDCGLNQLPVSSDVINSA